MKTCVLLVCMALIGVGCASSKLMRCPMPVEEPEVMECNSQVRDMYRMCKKPKHLYRCEDPR